MRYVAANNVRQMTFDNSDELRKIAKLFPDAELFLRILTDDSSSLCRLSQKFGASMDDTNNLLVLASQLGLNVVGVSFHVGSGASDPLAFLKAVRDAHVVFGQARALGFNPHTLDVGGGFCGDSFEAMAAVLREALDEYFPSPVNVIAEPGRYYVSSAFTIACSIIARRTIEEPTQPRSLGGVGGNYMLYLNDGLYGNFSSIMFDHQHPEAKVLRCGAHTHYGTQAAFRTDSHLDDHRAGANMADSACGVVIPTGRRVNDNEYSIWGPTCDGIDRITESIRFVQTLDVGDWLYFEDMGAYTKCSATKFNGFSDAHDVIYVCSEPGASALLELPLLCEKVGQAGAPGPEGRWGMACGR